MGGDLSGFRKKDYPVYLRNSIAVASVDENVTSAPVHSHPSSFFTCKIVVNLAFRWYWTLPHSLKYEKDSRERGLSVLSSEQRTKGCKVEGWRGKSYSPPNRGMKKHILKLDGEVFSLWIFILFTFFFLIYPMITLGCLSGYPRNIRSIFIILTKAESYTLSGKLDEIEIGKWTKTSKKKWS